MSKTEFNISNQTPEFIRENYPRFVEFLEEYYKFLDQYNVDYANVRDLKLDIEDISIFIRRELLNKFPSVQVDHRKLTHVIRTLYKSKGTFSAIELLFRIFFNESVIITQPGKNILRASDGRWNFETSVVLETLLGSFDLNSNITLSIENEKGSFYVEVLKVEVISHNQYKFFFRNTSYFQLDDNQIVYIYDNNIPIYMGILRPAPSKINIIEPGKYWKLGQVFTIEGSDLDTVCKVTNIGPNGELQGISIYKYGYNHSNNQITFISPFPHKPPDPVGYTKTIENYDPISGTYTFHHSLILTDTINRPFENIIGSMNDKEVYNQNVIPNIVSNDEILQTTITPEQYKESVTMLEFEYENVVTYRGEFSGDTGKLSNNNIRMQDNFFYQMFSYVIESTKNILEYKNVLDIIHPAGLKYFSSLAKTSLVDIDHGRHVMCSVSLLSLFLDDGITNVDNMIKHLHKVANNSVTTDDFLYINTNKVFSDSLTVSDGYPSPISDERWTSEDYFAENYAESLYTLTIT